jgi:hypothetical protein
MPETLVGHAADTTRTVTSLRVNDHIHRDTSVRHTEKSKMNRKNPETDPRVTLQADTPRLRDSNTEPTATSVAPARSKINKHAAMSAGSSTKKDIANPGAQKTPIATPSIASRERAA